MRILDRYIAVIYLANIVSLFVALSAFVVGVDVFLNLKNFVSAAKRVALCTAAAPPGTCTFASLAGTFPATACPGLLAGDVLTPGDEGQVTSIPLGGGARLLSEKNGAEWSETERRHAAAALAGSVAGFRSFAIAAGLSGGTAILDDLLAGGIERVLEHRAAGGGTKQADGA